jgi:putative phage-type endonuclease
VTSPIVVLPASAPREEWLQSRTRGVGGSEIAVLTGSNPYKTPYQLFQEKAKQKWVDLSDNPAIEWGSRLESAVAQAFAERTGLTVTEAEGLYQHPTYPFALASPDRLVYPDGILEVKTTGTHNRDNWHEGVLGLGGKAPDYYVEQLNWYLGILGRQNGWLAVLIGGQTFWIVEVPFDEELFNQQINAAAMFWAQVQSGTPPELADDHPDTADLLRMLEHPTTPEPYVLDNEGVALCQAIAKLKQKLKEMEVECTIKQNQLRKMIGSHESAVADNGYVMCTWKPYMEHRIDPEVLRAEYPEVAAKVTVEAERRPLRIRWRPPND